MKNIIEVTVEPVGSAWFVVRLTNQRRQVLLRPQPKTLQEALTEAYEVADFFGIKATDYVDAEGNVVKPEIVRDTYNDQKERTRESLIHEYRRDDGELNWNKVVEYEWKNVKGKRGFRDKRQFLEWVLPYFVSGKQDKVWLSLNAKGAWLMGKGGVRFTDKQDATLFKMFVDTLGECD